MKPITYPIREGDKLEAYKLQVTETEIKCYQSMINLVIFVMVCMRPDIAFAVLLISCFAKNPSNTHNEIIKQILYYLKNI